MLHASRAQRRFLWRGGIFAICFAAFLQGCSTPPLRSARENFYAGRFEQANTNLASIPKGDKDEILYLMERGMVRQGLGDFEASSMDWRRAAELDDMLETYSLSQGAASMVANDRTLAFRGMPFERTLMFAFLAKNYLAMSEWDYAAICARNIIKRLENLNGFPDTAYGRYMAGFCLETINDTGNAAIQYRAAGQLLTNQVSIDADSGAISPAGGPAPPAHPAPKQPSELICFIAFGRLPKGENCGSSRGGAPPFAEIFCGKKYLGRSYPFSNTLELMAASRKRLAAIQLAKDATRIAAKAAVAEAVNRQNEALGALVWLALFSMEMPDDRCWETLPMWLQIARVPCPADLEGYTVVFKNALGETLWKKDVSRPISRRGGTFISFCRDIGQ